MPFLLVLGDVQALWIGWACTEQMLQGGVPLLFWWCACWQGLLYSVHGRRQVLNVQYL